MLKLSENAASAVENIRSTEGIPESHDTRLSAEPQPTGQIAVRLEFVEDAPEDDQVVERDATEVYVDSRIVEQLSESVMDVQDTEQGLAFVFRPQG